MRTAVLLMAALGLVTIAFGHPEPKHTSPSLPTADQYCEARCGHPCIDDEMKIRLEGDFLEFTCHPPTNDSNDKV